jgi:hypothetical protein
MVIGTYVGVQPSSYANSCTVVYQEFSHEAMHSGRMVQYYHMWIQDRENPTIKPAFGENLNVKKIKELDKIFRK